MGTIVKYLTDFFDIINKGVIGLVGSGHPSLAIFLDLLIFTAIIKLILLPLTIKQIRSTVGMSKIQPEVKKLQDKYKNDPKMLQQKQMELYKELGVNPLAGCLPILIQFPIFIAMYQVVNAYTGFQNVSFFWIKDLAQIDYFLDLKFMKLGALPIISGLTTYISGMMMAPKGDDPQAKTQKQMNIFMSIFFIYMSGNFKAALVLYWTISNVLQMLQQYFILNRIKRKEEEKLAK